jgi:hypothetical protein
VFNLPSVPASRLAFPAGPPGSHVSALSAPGTCPVRPVMREPLAEKPVHGPGFPLPFGAPDIRFSSLPAPAGEVSLPHGRPTGRPCLPDPNGVVTFRLVAAQQWDARRLDPGDRGSLLAGRWTPASTCCRLPVAIPALPLERSACGSPRNEASSAIHLRSPVRPFSGLCPPDGPGALSLPLGFAPRSHPRRTPGREQSCELDRDYVTSNSRSSFCEFHSLQATSCRTHRSWYGALSACAGMRGGPGGSWPPGTRRRSWCRRGRSRSLR